MSEHTIRLRGAWELLEEGAVGPRRVALPTAWPDGPGAPFRLTRRFGRPPTAAGREAVRLRLESVAGLTAVRLNGQDLARPGPGTSSLTLDLSGLLLARNVLDLEVDPSAWPDPGGGDEPWGSIALVIAPA